ncbi:hypothetical protein TNCV_4942351 [Trichonephila clavipes]|nr:hypothetical protein TNCV_4942351 [Trichonephila clavipes]
MHKINGVPYPSSSAEVPDTQGYEKRHWFKDYPGSGENDSKIRRDGVFFHEQFDRGKKRVDSTVVERVVTAKQEESTGGLQLCSARGIA